VIAKSAVGAIALDPTGRSVAFVSNERQVRVYDAQLSAFSARLRVVGTPSELQFGIDGIRAAGPEGYEAWSRDERGVAKPPDSAWALLGAAEPRFGLGDEAALVKAWEPRRADIIQASSVSTEEPGAAAFSPDGDRLVVCSSDRTAHMWSSGAPVPIAKEEITGTVRRVRFAPDGAQVALALDDGRVELRGAALEPRVLLETGEGTDVAVTFAEGGHVLLAGARDGRLLRWQLDSPAAPVVIANIGGPVVELATSADGRWLIASTEAGPVQLFALPEVRLQALVNVKPRAGSVHFDASRRAFVVATSSWSTAWFAESGEDIWKRTLEQQQLSFDEGLGRFERRE
jgi:WD40 repeat protein